MIYEVDFLPVGHLGRGSIAECLFFWMKGKILSRNSGPIASGATAPSAGDQCGAEDDQQQPGERAFSLASVWMHQQQGDQEYRNDRQAHKTCEQACAYQAS